MENSTIYDNTTGSETIPNSMASFSRIYIQVPILATGILFNVINVVVIQNIKKPIRFHYFIESLSFSDLGMSVFGVIYILMLKLLLGTDILEGNRYSNFTILFYCLRIIYVCFHSTSSVITLVGSSIRSHMLRNPYKYTQKVKKSTYPQKIRLICLNVFICILLILSVNLPFFIWMSCQEVIVSDRFCSSFYLKFPYIEKMKYYLMIIGLILAPGIIIANMVCFITIIFELRKANHKNSVLRKSQKYKRAKRDERVISTLKAILIIDTVCIFPEAVRLMVFALRGRSNVFNSNEIVAGVIFSDVSQIVFTIRPTYNLLVYLRNNTEYRRVFKSLFCYSRETNYNNQGMDVNIISSLS